MSEALPVGWRSGFYTFAELQSLGVQAETLADSLERYREWEEAFRASLAAIPEGERLMPVAEASGVIWPVGPGDRFCALVVCGCSSIKPYLDGRSSLFPPYAGRPFQETDLPGVKAEPGSKVLFARLWHRGALLPCLTLRATRGASPSIALEGLETLFRLSDAEPLLKQVRSLERLSAAGAPSLDSRDYWRERALRSFELERELPRRPLKRIAAELFTSKATLCRWRAKLRAEGSVPNS